MLPSPQFIGIQTKVKRINDTLIKGELKWTFDEFAEPLVDKMYVSYSKSSFGKKNWIMLDSFPPSIRKYTHIYHDKNSDGLSANYRISIKSKEKDQWERYEWRYDEKRGTKVIQLTKVKPPRIVKTTLEKRENGSYDVILEWEQDGDTTDIEGYFIYEQIKGYE